MKNKQILNKDLSLLGRKSKRIKIIKLILINDLSPLENLLELYVQQNSVFATQHL